MEPSKFIKSYLVSTFGDSHGVTVPEGLFSNMHEVFYFMENRLKEKGDSTWECCLHVMKLNQKWRGKFNYCDYIILLSKSDDSYCMTIDDNNQYTIDELPEHLEGFDGRY